MYNEASGPSLSREIKGKPALHHIRLHGSSASTEEKPAWVVSHYKSERDRSPVEHHFNDGTELMEHLAKHANVPAPTQDEGDN